MGDEQMEKITIYSGECFPLQPDREEVFGWLRCGEDLPCRAAHESAWDQAVTLLRQTAAPRAVALRAEADSLILLLTLGERAESQASRLFRLREYILGSLLNVLCDELLFQMDHRLTLLLQRDLAEEGLAMTARTEPGPGFPVAEQRRFLSMMEHEIPDIRLSEHGVISPAKSMMFRVTLSQGDQGCVSLHDCANCPQKKCLYRSVKETVRQGIE